jgi:MFS family permease
LVQNGKPGVSPAGMALGSARRGLVFLVVLLCGVATSMVYTVVSPILPKISDHFGGGRSGEMSSQLGASMPGLGIILGGALSGWVVARLGLRPLLILAIVAFGVFGAAGGYFSHLWGFSVTRLMLGFAGTFMTTAVVALLAEIYDESGRSKMIGYWKAAMGLSTIGIVIGSGALADRFGWQASFLLYAGLAAPTAILALLVLPSAKAAAKAPIAKATPEDRASVLRLWPILLMIFLLHVMIMMSNNQIPFVLRDRGLVSSKEIALIMGLAAPAGGVGSILSGHLQTRFGERQVLCMAIIATGLGCIAIALAPTSAGVGIGNALKSFGAGTILPLYMTMPLNRVSVGGRASAIGLVQVSQYLGAFLNPYVIRPLTDAFGQDGAFMAVGVASAAAAILALVRIGLQGRTRPSPAAS